MKQKKGRLGAERGKEANKKEKGMKNGEEIILLKNLQAIGELNVYLSNKLQLYVCMFPYSTVADLIIWN